MVNEKANVHVTLNSKEAQHQLEELQGEMKRLIELKKKAEEAGDVEGYKKIDKEIKKVSRSANKLVREHRNLEHTLKNLNGASIDELQNAQRTLTAQTKKLNRETTEYAEKRAQLKLVKKEISNINSQYRQQQSLVSRLTNGFNKYFAVITAGAASFAGAILGIRKAVDISNQFEETSDNLAALTGLGEEQMKYLEKQAEDTSHAIVEGGVRIKQSANDILDAYTLVGSQRPELLKNAEALHEVTLESIILSEAAKMQLEPAAAALANTLNQFNENSDQSRRIINILAAGSQAGAGNIEYLSKAVEKNGTTFNLMNVSIEESIAAIETVAPYYARAEMAGNSLDKVLLRMKADQIGYKDGVFDLNRAIDELRERYANGETAVSIFGVEHAKMAELLVLNQNELKRYTTLVSGSNKAIEQATTNTDNNNAKLAQARNERELVIKQLGQKLSPVLTHVTSKSTLMFKTLIALVDVFTKYGRTLIVTTAAVGAYWLAVKIAANWTKIHYAYLITAEAASKAYAFTVGVVTGKIKLATIAQKAWNLAQKANPIGLVTGLVVGAGVALAGYIKKTRDAAKEQKELNTQLEHTDDLLGAQLYQQFLEEIGLFKDDVLTMADGSKKFIKVFDESVDVLDKFGEKVKSLKENDLENFKNFFENEIVNLQHSLENLDPESILYLTNEAKVQEYSDALKLVNKELAVFAEKRKKLDDDSDTTTVTDPKKLKEQSDLFTAVLEQEANKKKALLTQQLASQEITEKEYNDRILILDLLLLEDKQKALEKYGQDSTSTLLDIANKQLEITKNRIEKEKEIAKESSKTTGAVSDMLPEEEEDDFDLATSRTILNYTQTLEFKELLLKSQLEKDLITETEYLEQLDELREKYADKEKARKEKLSQSLVHVSQYVTDAVMTLMDMELEKAGDNEEEQKKIKKKYADIGFAIQAAEIITSTAVAAMNAYKALAGIPYVGPALGAAAAIAVGITGAAQLGIANAQRQQVKALAQGKYDIPADDGKTYRANYNRRLQTGMYNGPQLAVFNEVPGEPEMVVDGVTNRNLRMNYPEVIEAIYAVRDGRQPQRYATGKYQETSTASSNLTQPYTPIDVDKFDRAVTRMENLEFNLSLTELNTRLKKLEKRNKQKNLSK